MTRRPVLAIDGELYAYELFGRSAADEILNDDDHTLATRCLLHTVLNAIGLTELIGDNRLVISMSARNLIDEDYIVLPANKTVIQLDAGVELSTEFVAACAAAHEAKYRLALQVHNASVSDDLIALADMVRIDFGQAADPAMRDVVARVRKAGRLLLADNVESKDQSDSAQALGFNLLCGGHFCKPDVKSGSTLSGAKALKLQFLSALNETPLDFNRVENAIKCDASLTLKLLRYLNSAAMGMRERITSIHHALRLLGEKPIRKWGTLVAIDGLADEKPHELLVTALVRARFAEDMANAMGLTSESLEFHLVGLLSVMDAMLDLPIDQALHTLPLSDSVRAAILGDTETPAGCALAIAKSCEHGAWSSVASLGVKTHLPQRDIASRFYQAVSWTNRFMSGLTDIH